MSNSRSLAKLPAFLSPAGVLSPQAGGTGTNNLTDAVNALNLTIGEDVQAWHSTLDAIVAIPGTTGLLKKTGTNTWTLETSAYLTGITSSQVTTALGYTPYNSSNPSGYITGITSSNVTTALGFTPYNSTNPSGYISGITSSNVTTALGYTPENSALKGSANGYASLDGSGLVPASQLPSYVDDVLEYANLAGFPATGTTGKIYVALDTNKTYRWSGSAYVYITSGAVDSVAGKTGVVSLTSSDVGLANVENKSSATIRSEISSANVTGALGFTPYNATNPSGYISGITSANVTTALGFTPYNATNPNGYITGITSANVTSALGFTPYNATNPAGYITSSALSSYLPLSGGTVTGTTRIGNLSIGYGTYLNSIRPTGDTNLNLDTPSGATYATNLFVNNNQAIHAGNYTSYSPSLTGSGASGTWGINVTGYSNYVNKVEAYQWSNSTLPSGYNSGIETSFVSSAQGFPQYGVVLSVMGRSPSDPGGNFQLYMGHGTDYGGLGLRVRSVNQANNAWTSWKILLDETNYTGYALPTSSSATNSVDIRSPIFYDSNNTGYYVDPASTSRFVNTIIGGHGGQAYDTAVNGRLYLGTNADNSYSIYTHLESVNGNYTKLTLDWHTGIKIGAYKSYGGTRFYNNAINSGGAQIFSVGEGDDNVRVSYNLYTPFTYDSNDTGYYIDPNSNSRLANIFAGNVASSNDGGWNARFNLVGSAHARMDVVSNSDGIITTMYSHTGQGVGRVGTYSNHPLTLMAQGGAEGGRVYSGSLRSGSFYDLDDTGYYIDPNSTSDSALRMRGGALFGANTTWGAYLAVGGNGWVGSGSYASVAATNGNLHMDAATGCDMYLNYYVQNPVRSYGSLMTPIMYDLNDTGYYVNPNGTTNLNQLNVRAGAAFTNLTDVGASTAPVRIEHTSTGTGDVRWIPMIAGTSTASLGYNQHTVFGSVRGTVWGAAFIGVGGNDSYPTVAYTFHYEGYGTAPSSWRAPIFYDSNDTNYFADPNSTSSFNVIKSYDLRYQTDVSADNTYGMYFDASRASSYAIYRAGGAWTHPYPDLRIAFHTGIQLGANSGYGGTRFYNDYDMGTEIFSVGNTDNNVRVAYTLYSPNLYDSNNTAYYVDAAGTTVLNALTVGGQPVTGGGGDSGPIFSAF